MILILIYERDKNPLLDAWNRRIFQDRTNMIIVVTGAKKMTQVGKSQWAVSYAWTMDKKYTFERNVGVIVPEECMRIISQGEKRGFIPIYDDAGLGIPAEDWNKGATQKLSRIFQIIGNRGYVLVITTPHISYIPAKVRKLITDKILVYGIKKRTYIENGKEVIRKAVKFKYYCDVHYDDEGKKMYKQFPIKVFKNGSRMQIDTFYLKVAPKDVLDEFYANEGPAKDKYSSDTQSQMEEFKEAQSLKALTEKEKVDMLVNKIILNSFDFISEYRGRRFIDESKIKEQFQTPNFIIGRRLCNVIKKRAEERLEMS